MISIPSIAVLSLLGSPPSASPARSPVDATEPTQVLVLAPEGLTATSRLVDELHMAGFRVVRGSTREQADPNTRAVIELEADATGLHARLWVDGQAQPEVSATTLSDDTADTLALRSVEQLHATLLALDAAPPPPSTPEPVEPPEPAPAPTPEPPPEPMRWRGGGAWAVGLQAGVAGGPDSGGVLPMVGLGGFWSPHPWVGVQADVFVSPTTLQVEADPGTARVGLSTLTAGVHVRPLDHRVSPRVGLVGGATVVWGRGQAERRLEGRRATRVVGTLGGAAALDVWLHPSWLASAGLDVLVTVPEVEVGLLDTTPARWGRPLFVGHVGFAWGGRRQAS